MPAPSLSEYIGALDAGTQAGRQQREDNYIASQRAFYDPIKQREAGRVDSARGAMVDKFGPMAGDVQTASQLSTMIQNEELHPGRVAAQGQALEAGEQALLKAKVDNFRQGAKTVLGGLEAVQKQGGDVAAWAQQTFTPELREALGITSDEGINQIIQAGQTPEGLEALRRMFTNPETVFKVLEGTNTRTGQRAAYAVTDQQPGGFIPDFKPDAPGTAGRYTFDPATGTVFDKVAGVAVSDPNIIRQVAGGAQTIAGSKTGGQETAKADVAAAEAWPKVQNSAQTMREDVGRVLNSPGLDAILGNPADFAKLAQGGAGALGAYPGSPAANAAAAVDALKSDAFMQAFETLKGGGQITETEGAKATDALVMLQRTVDPKVFRDNLRVFLSELDRLEKIAKERVGRAAQRGYAQDAVDQTRPPAPAALPSDIQALMDQYAPTR